MALVLKDRVKQTAAAPGTGTITLGATAAGFQSFASVGNGNTTYYAIVDPVSGDWEVNYGVYTSSGTTLTRNATPLSSSTGTLVNFTGTVDVFLTYPSEKAVWQDLSGVVAQQSFGAITATSAALTSGTITTAPVNATDIVNKEYADSIASGLNYHQPVNYGSTAALPAYTYNNGSSGVGATITANANGALSLGGGSPTATQRVLIKDEVSGNAPYNGVYVVTQAGSAGTPFILTRATDYDTSGTGTNEIDQGDYVLVISGTLASTAWVQQTPLPITVGTTALTFLQFNAPITYTAGTGLNLSPATTFNISNTGVSASTYGSASAVPVFAVNAQGQITSVTNTNIAISGSAVSGNISGSAGSVANSLTLGTYLTGGTYNGSAAVTATVDATSANTASKVVARDSSGNFSAGTITATLSGSATSATTATNLTGGAANQIAYQSASGTTSFATAPSASNQVLSWNGSAFSWSAGTISGVPLGSNLNSLTAGTYLTGTAYNGSAAQTWSVNATSANTASTVVARDASGNFSASTITASLSGNATSATTATTATTSTYSTYLSSVGSYVWNNATASTGYVNGISNSFVDPSGGFPSYGDVMTMNSYPGGGGALQLYSPYGSAYPDLNLRFRTADYSAGGAWTAWKIILDSANYNSYAPTLTGTGASGTWSINVTGSAGSAGSATTAVTLTSTQSNWASTGVVSNVVGMLGWKNYGNSHVIFDASNSTSPSGTSVNNTNPTYAWGASYPTLMGWNGSATYGVRVDRAYQADYLYSSLAAYATIYYDYNNTAFYLDPASNVSAALAGSVGLNTTNPINPAWGTASTTKQLFVYGNNYAVFNLRADDISSTYYTMGAGGGRFYAAYDNNTGVHRLTFYGDNTGFNNVTSPSYNIHLAGTGYATSDWRAPIFYDSDNTSYYADPSGTSQFNEFYANNIYANAGQKVWARYAGGTTYAASLYWNSLQLGNNGNNYIFAGQNATGGLLDIYVNATSYSPTVSGTHAARFDSNGYVYNFVATASPIFYDYNNSAYYVDPASTSNLNNLTIGNYNQNQSYPGILICGNTGYNYNFSNGSWSSSITAGILANCADQWEMAIHDSGERVVSPFIFYGGTGANYILMGRDIGWGTTYIQAASSFRAPIFYDSNDTTYYVDPNSVSSQSSILVGYNSASPYVYNVASTGYLTFGTTSDTANYAIKTEIENYSGAYSKLRFKWYTGIQYYASNYYGGHRFYDIDGTQYFGIGVGSGANWSYSIYSHRAPIFYDLDNTGYYVDPASTSILNVLNCYGNVTAYYSSDIKFKTNVRDIPNAIETVESIGGKLFDWTDEYLEEHGGEDPYFMRKEDFGVVAQDVLKVFPVAVRTRPDGSLAVDYEKLSALAFAAVAELSTRVKSLEARI